MSVSTTFTPPPIPFSSTPILCSPVRTVSPSPFISQNERHDELSISPKDEEVIVNGFENECKPILKQYGFHHFSVSVYTFYALNDVTEWLFTIHNHSNDPNVREWTLGWVAKITAVNLIHNECKTNYLLHKAKNDGGQEAIVFNPLIEALELLYKEIIEEKSHFQNTKPYSNVLDYLIKYWKELTLFAKFPLQIDMRHKSVSTKMGPRNEVDDGAKRIFRIGVTPNKSLALFPEDRENEEEEDELQKIIKFFQQIWYVTMNRVVGH